METGPAIININIIYRHWTLTIGHYKWSFAFIFFSKIGRNAPLYGILLLISDSIYVIHCLFFFLFLPELPDQSSRLEKDRLQITIIIINVLREHSFEWNRHIIQPWLGNCQLNSNHSLCHIFAAFFSSF